MAISGSGTQDNPYIVDNWADFLTCLGRNNAYIKWADIAVKKLPEVVISTELSALAKSVDFNGWTIESLLITKTFNSNRPYIVNVSSISVYNLTIEYMSWNDPRHTLISGIAYLYNCFFDNITVQKLPNNSYWWRNGQSETRRGMQTGIFNGIALYNSIVYLNSQDANIIIPRGEFYSCEVYCNYKYTLDNAAEPTHGIFMRGSAFHNCYVSGKIDISEGMGHFDVVRADGTEELQSGGVTVNNTIINLETMISDPDCYVSETHARTWAIFGTGKSFFVTNNGNNYTYYNGTISDLAKGLLSDLRNSDELIREGVVFMEDDKTRYPQYALDNSTKDWTFRKSVNVNTGIPFLPFWKYPTYEPPTPEGHEVYENPYLTVYDMETKQDNFDNHGLAILCPTSGRIIEELNGEYSLSFTHPRDTDNKWQYVLEMNVVKALGQLFVIQKVDEVQSGGSGYVSAYAEHITYTLNDKWIFPPVTIAGYNGQTLIDSIMQQATDLGYDWQTTYDFDITTDLNAPEGFRDWYEMSEGVTPYEMLIGGNGFVAKLGGELYRDNFHMSINSRMEGARDNAFELAIGYNLTGIKRTVDLTTFCTYLRGYDISNGDYDNWFAVGWDPSTLPRPYPREVVRSTNFYYEHPEYAEEGQLVRDTMLFFNQNCAPLVSYELNVVDLRRNPDYKMFSNNYRFKVGDKGRVWDERLKAWLELEITRTEHDIITGDCVKVVIGTQRSFTRPVGYQPVISRGMIIPDAEKVLEGVPPLYFNCAENKLRDWIIYGTEGGVGKQSENMWHGSLINGTFDTKGEIFPYSFRVVNETYFDVSQYNNVTINISEASLMDVSVALYDTNKSFLGVTGWQSIPYVVTTDNCDFIRLVFRYKTDEDILPEDVSDIMLNVGATPKPYEPYGYYIPVTVSHSEPIYYATGNGDRYGTQEGMYRLADDVQSQTVSIPIDQPLEEGESISLADTGIDIPTYIGDNTLDIDTIVKPRVKITYKEG